MRIWERGHSAVLLAVAGAAGTAGQAAAQGGVALPSWGAPGANAGNMRLLLFVAGAAIALVILLKLVNRWMGSQRLPAPRAAGPRRVSADFSQLASRMGFKVAEIKTLRLVTSQLAPEVADDLLSTEEGQARLFGYIEKRLRRRERELEHLRGILAKLRLVRERGVRERASVRVETNLPVWIVRKVDTSEAAGDDEGVYADVEQVSGRMLDLSEGGAAVATELEAGTEDLVELWSGDAEVWIPPVTAAVLQVQRQGVQTPVFHLHFLDPPVAELRAAIQAIQRHTGAGRT